MFDTNLTCIVFTHSGDDFLCNLNECVPWGLISVLGAIIIDAEFICLSEDELNEWQSAAVREYRIQTGGICGDSES